MDWSVILLIFLFISRIQSQCSINIKTDLNRSGSLGEPLFVKKDGNKYKLKIPENGILEFENNETVFVECTSDKKPNFLKFTTNKSSAEISCNKGKKFIFETKILTVTEQTFSCNSKITGNTKKHLNDRPCGDSGTRIHIGFQLNGGRGFVDLIEVCYNMERGSTIYAEHVIRGKTIDNKMTNQEKSSYFKKDEISNTLDPMTAFTKKSQTQRFPFITATTGFLEKGHLAPAADFIFGSWQHSTNYFINTVPQWQSINNGNWRCLEGKLRTKAGQLKKDLNIITGGYEVLFLEGKSMSLENDAIDVPKWTWKIAVDPTSDSGIVFVTYNNPLATQAPESLCIDICNKNGWLWESRNVLRKGLTICCEVSDFKRKVPTLEIQTNVSRILKGPTPATQGTFGEDESACNDDTTIRPNVKRNRGN